MGSLVLNLFLNKTRLEMTENIIVLLQTNVFHFLRKIYVFFWIYALGKFHRALTEVMILWVQWVRAQVSNCDFISRCSPFSCSWPTNSWESPLAKTMLWLYLANRRVATQTVPTIHSPSYRTFHNFPTEMVFTVSRMRKNARSTNETSILIGWARLSDNAQPISIQNSFVLRTFLRILSFFDLPWLPLFLEYWPFVMGDNVNNL